MDSIIINPTANATACVIWLHGLGADGHDFAQIVPQLNVSDLNIRFVFPHAPIRPVTINRGAKQRAWFDITGFDFSGLDSDVDGLNASREIVEGLINEQIKQGMPSERIMLAGFSQGGAVALYAGLTHAGRLGGIMGLSTYLPLIETVQVHKQSLNQAMPIFLTHGVQDTLLPESLGRLCQSTLSRWGYAIEWHDYPMGHEVCLAELEHISEWLRKIAN